MRYLENNNGIDKMALARISVPLLFSVLCCSCSEETASTPSPTNPAALYEQALALLKPNVENAEPDVKGALALLEKAARAGHVRACLDMAGIYMEGSKDGSVKADAKAAFFWASKAAALGDSTADYLCALLLLTEGKTQAAAPYLDKALSAHLAEAYLLKAFILLDSEHVADILRIYAHTRRGSIMQQMEAQKSLDRIMRVRFNDSFLQTLTAAAQAGSPDAMYFLGRYYIIQKDSAAISWLTKAAESGHPATVAKAAYTLATQYEDDLPTAMRWYKIAADSGDARAQYMLALRLLSGDGVEANVQQGEALLRLAAGQHYAPAVEQLIRYLFAQDAEAYADEIHAWQKVFQQLSAHQ